MRIQQLPSNITQPKVRHDRYVWHPKNVLDDVGFQEENVSRKSGWKLNGTRPFWLFEWKISGSDGTSKMVVVLPFGDLQTAIRVPFLQSHL